MYLIMYSLLGLACTRKNKGFSEIASVMLIVLAIVAAIVLGLYVLNTIGDTG